MKILNLGCGRKYMEGAMNVDIDGSVKADAYVDLSQSVYFDRDFSYDKIICHHLLEHIRELPELMTNCMLLLKEGGEMEIQVPYDLSYGAWQDPTHVRALNERSWIYYDEWSWYLENYSKEWLNWGLKTKNQQFILGSLGLRLQQEYFDAERNGSTLREYQLQEILTSTPRAIDEMHVTLVKVKK